MTTARYLSQRCAPILEGASRPCRKLHHGRSPVCNALACHHRFPTRTQLREHLSNEGYGSAYVDSIFELLDVNADGGISRDELRASFVRYEDPALRLA